MRGLDCHAGPAAKLSITEHVANDSHVLLSGEKEEEAEPLARWHEGCNTGTSAHVTLSSCKTDDPCKADLILKIEA